VPLLRTPLHQMSFVAEAARRARDQHNTIVRHSKPAFGSALSTGRSTSAADGRRHHRRSVWNGETRGAASSVDPQQNHNPPRLRVGGGGGGGGGGGANDGGGKPNVAAARSQLWAIVEEISGQLDTAADGEGGESGTSGGSGAPPRSPLPPVLHAPAQKLRRLLNLHQRMQQQERTLWQTHVAVLRERNEYMRRLSDVEGYVGRALAARSAAGLAPGDGLLEQLRALLDGGRDERIEGEGEEFPNPYR